MKLTDLPSRGHVIAGKPEPKKKAPVPFVSVDEWLETLPLSESYLRPSAIWTPEDELRLRKRKDSLAAQLKRMEGCL